MPIDVLQASVRLALDARNAARANGGRRSANVFLSLGPWGATQADGSEYTGSYASTATKKFLETFHSTRLSLLLGGGGGGGGGGGRPASDNTHVDGLAFETIPSALELEAILPLLSTPQCSSLPAWVTFSSKDGVHMCDGSLLSSAVERCVECFAGAEGERFVGLNCVDPQHVDGFLDVVLPILSSGDKMKGVVLYPNNGGTWNAETRCWCDPASSGESGSRAGGRGYYVQKATEWRDRVTSKGMCVMIGGCCSTDATTIRKLRECLVKE
jgi:homocysteine S-methyltransferase